MSNKSTTYLLTERAFLKGELDKLLLGEEDYAYVPKYSPAIRTDWTRIIPYGVYEYHNENPDSGFLEMLLETLFRMVKSYDGIVPVAYVILTECSEREDGVSPFSFDLAPLAIELNKSIHKYFERLSLDRNKEGFCWEDGLLGELRCICKKTIDCGGPDFLQYHSLICKKFDSSEYEEDINKVGSTPKKLVNFQGKI